MRRGLFPLLNASAMGVLAAGTAPATAQEAVTGSHFLRPAAPRYDTGGDRVTNDTRMLMALGACVEDRRPDLVHAYLTASPGSSEQRRIAGLFDSTECLTDANMRISTGLLRGAIYYGAYRAEYGRAAPAPVATITIDYDAGFANGRPEGMMMSFVDCVYRTDPTAARRLLFSTVTSSAQQAAMAALSPAMSKCVDPKFQMRFNQAMLRASLAEAAYRISKASGASPASAAKGS